MVEPGKGNLLAAQVEALVNTVNTVGVMGKGLALQFKKAFPENTRAYEKACRAAEVQIGKMHVVDRGLLQPRWIINFPTKKHWRPSSKLSYIDEGLVDLVQVVRDRGIRSLALPPLGCGNGGLDWADVYPRVVAAFESLSDVRVVVFAPDGAPSASAMIDRRVRPPMSAGRAAFLSVVAQYERTGYEYCFTLLEAQKLAYFLHVAGDLESLRFEPNRYGPYADGLRHVLVALEGHYTCGYGDANVRPDTTITLLPGVADEAAEFLEAQPETLARLERVKQVIDGFETPFGMELLATVHWVAAHETKAPRAHTVKQAVDAVHAWSPRKAELMKPGHVAVAWDRLSNLGWIANRASDAPA